MANFPLELNTFIASFVVNEIKEFDTFSGGSTKVSVIRKKGFQEIPDKIVSKNYNAMVNLISINLPRSFAQNKKIAKKILKGYVS